MAYWLSSYTPKPKMSCDFPLTAWRSKDVDSWRNGKAPMVFREDLGYPNTKMDLPCGQCAGCRLDRARSWAIRCIHEASLHRENCFLTLTYDNEHLPENQSLRPDDIVLFLKRLRKLLSPKKIRFLQCGEYGDEGARPHHHMLLFGHDFPDKLLLRHGDNPLYASQTLTTLWGQGFCSIGALTFDSACYTARYILKKITGDKAGEHYNGRVPEYITMSRRPGIAADWFNRFAIGDIYAHDKCVVRAGFLARPPKYYDRLYEAVDPNHYALIKRQRAKKAAETAAQYQGLEADDRRAVLKQIREIKYAKIQRKYEKIED